MRQSIRPRTTGRAATVLGTLAALLAVAGTAGCARTISGAAVPAEPPARAGAPTSSPHALPVTVLDSLLLTQDQLVVLAGGTNLALIHPISSTSDASGIIDDRSCLGVSSVGDASIYSNSGYVGMRGNQFSSPNTVEADITQLLTSFTTNADAATMLQRARQDWQGCSKRRYGFHSSNGNHSYFDTEDLSATGSRIEVTMRQEEDPRWGCAHAMAAQNNVLAEARVCLLSKDTAVAVNKLLDQVVARIPQ
jgi:PknH-like extracellular domain